MFSRVKRHVYFSNRFSHPLAAILKAFPEFLHKKKLLRLSLVAGSLLLAVALLALGVWLLKSASRPKATIEVVPPAAPDTFLVLIAPFRHDGGEVYDFGAELANDLQQQAVSELFQVQMLAAQPAEEVIPELAASSRARAIITGIYDENSIEAQLYFIPPDTLPVAGPESDGRALLMPDLTPTHYTLYAPRGLGHPLQYLQNWLLGQHAFWQGNYDAAMDALTMARHLLPTVIPVAQRTHMDHFAASILWSLGYIQGPVRHDWPAARGFFYQAMSLQSDALPAILGLAAARAQLHDAPGAQALLQNALRQHPQEWQIHFALAEIKAQQGNTQEARVLFEQAIDLLSGADTPAAQQALADVYFNRGYFFYQQEDYESALADYQQAQALGRADLYLLSNLGWTAYLLGDYETALTASTQAAALAPQRPELGFNKALHLLAAGRYDEADAAYDAAIQLTLKNDDVLTRSTYFGVAYQDLADLAQKRPDLQSKITELQSRIDIANG